MYVRNRAGNNEIAHFHSSMVVMDEYKSLLLLEKIGAILISCEHVL